MTETLRVLAVYLFGVGVFVLIAASVAANRERAEREIFLVSYDPVKAELTRFSCANDACTDDQYLRDTRASVTAHLAAERGFYTLTGCNARLARCN